MIERAAANLSRCMLGAAEAPPGHQVLDLATGVGEPALTAAGRVGPDGNVIGMDFSAEMIELAKSRARAAGIRNAEFRVGDMEALALQAVMRAVEAYRCSAGTIRMVNVENQRPNSGWYPVPGIRDTHIVRSSRGDPR